MDNNNNQKIDIEFIKKKILINLYNNIKKLEKDNNRSIKNNNKNVSNNDNKIKDMNEIYENILSGEIEIKYKNN